MRFQIEKTKLLSALNTVIGAVPNKATIQVLNNFAIRLEGNTLEISATDLDLGIRVKLEVQAEADGAVVVNARRLLDLIKGLIDPKIEILTIEVIDYLVTVRWSEHGKASITGFDVSDFPPLPDVADGESFELGKSELDFLAGKTLFSVSTDQNRQNLNGAYMDMRPGKLIMVATDGHRLGKAFIELEGNTIEKGFIVPPKAIQFALKSIPNDSTIEIRVSDTYVLFANDGVQIVSKLIEGPYPKYEAVIPSSFQRTVQLNRTDFFNKISTVISMANARTRMLRLRLDGNQMELSASDANIGGDSTEALSVVHEGEGVYDIGFNGNYMLEVLKLCQCEEVILRMNGPLSACIIEPVGTDMNCMFLLMPLRLVDE